jgi:surfeit locus 1 family protein
MTSPGVVDTAGATAPPRPPRVTARGVAAALLALVVALVCIRLGFWQLDRRAQRADLNRALAAAAALPPLELNGTTLAGIAADPERHLYRRVRLRGLYAADAELVIRGRSLAGSPGVNLVTPLLLDDGGGTVLVNRGWTYSPDAASIEPAPLSEPRSVAVEGILQPLGFGVQARELPVHAAGRELRTVQRLDGATLAAELPPPLLPLVVQQLPAGPAPPAGLTRLPPPVLDDGPHLGYAVQWFSFAAIALIGFLVTLLLGRRRHAG